MRRRRNGFIRLLGVLFTFGCVAILAVAGAAGFLIWQAAGSLPDYKKPRRPQARGDDQGACRRRFAA
jgi:hypothetical protein